jgi:16S rRNA (cytidine1402-2'-O)-methyltransferase
VGRVREGEVVAVVSDAGMPGVSDPGFVVVDAALRAGVVVEVLPGASAVTAAVVASGLPAERWTFVGFLPRKAGELAGTWTAVETLVAFESPRRLAASLGSLASVDPERPVAVCRELTKVHEEVVRGTASELAARYAGSEVRGEIVLVVGGAAVGAGDEARGVEALRELVDAGARTRPAAAVVARLTGASANALYRQVAASSGSRGRSEE